MKKTPPETSTVSFPVGWVCDIKKMGNCCSCGLFKEEGPDYPPPLHHTISVQSKPLPPSSPQRQLPPSSPVTQSPSSVHRTIDQKPSQMITPNPLPTALPPSSISSPTDLLPYHLPLPVLDYLQSLTLQNITLASRVQEMEKKFNAVTQNLPPPADPLSLSSSLSPTEQRRPGVAPPLPSSSYLRWEQVQQERDRNNELLLAINILKEKLLEAERREKLTSSDHRTLMVALGATESSLAQTKRELVRMEEEREKERKLKERAENIALDAEKERNCSVSLVRELRDQLDEISSKSSAEILSLKQLLGETRKGREKWEGEIEKLHRIIEGKNTQIVEFHRLLHADQIALLQAGLNPARITATATASPRNVRNSPKNAQRKEKKYREKEEEEITPRRDHSAVAELLSSSSSSSLVSPTSSSAASLLRVHVTEDKNTPIKIMDKKEGTTITHNAEKSDDVISVDDYNEWMAHKQHNQEILSNVIIIKQQHESKEESSSTFGSLQPQIPLHEGGDTAQSSAPSSSQLPTTVYPFSSSIPPSQSLSRSMVFPTLESEVEFNQWLEDRKHEKEEEEKRAIQEAERVRLMKEQDSPSLPSSSSHHSTPSRPSSAALNLEGEREFQEWLAANPQTGEQALREKRKKREIHQKQVSADSSSSSSSSSLPSSLPLSLPSSPLSGGARAALLAQQHQVASALLPAWALKPEKKIRPRLTRAEEEKGGQQQTEEKSSMIVTVENESGVDSSSTVVPPVTIAGSKSAGARPPIHSQSTHHLGALHSRYSSLPVLPLFSSSSATNLSSPLQSTASAHVTPLTSPASAAALPIGAATPYQHTHSVSNSHIFTYNTWQAHANQQQKEGATHNQVD